MRCGTFRLRVRETRRPRRRPWEAWEEEAGSEGIPCSSISFGRGLNKFFAQEGIIGCRKRFSSTRKASHTTMTKRLGSAWSRNRVSAFSHFSRNSFPPAASDHKTRLARRFVASCCVWTEANMGTSSFSRVSFFPPSFSIFFIVVIEIVGQLVLRCV